MAQKKEPHKILINAVDPEECRIALLKAGRLENFSIQTAAGELLRGNIYKAVVTRVEPSLQAAFVDYGADRNGFLQQHELTEPRQTRRQILRSGTLSSPARNS
jgi:Rne/Rng family ribonuclease